MIIFKFLILMLACCALYMCYKAEYLTTVGIMAGVLAMACIITALII